MLQDVHVAAAYPLNWPDDPMAWLAEPGTLAAWVATGADGSVCGQVSVRFDPAGDRPTAELSRLFIAPSEAGRGLGGALLDTATAWAAAREVRLRLTVIDTAAAAIALYRRHGWQLIRAGVAAGWTDPAGGPVWLQEFRAPD